MILAQFRTGSHWLRVEADRFLWPKPERHLRICRHCHDGVEDEQHVIFTCPKYAAQRRQFPDLFGEEISGVSDFMRQDARRVASFIVGVHSRRMSPSGEGCPQGHHGLNGPMGACAPSPREELPEYIGLSYSQKGFLSPRPPSPRSQPPICQLVVQENIIL